MPAVAVVNAEPVPLSTPFKLVVTANVPAPVIGLFATEKPVGIERPTEVTDPVPGAAAAMVWFGQVPVIVTFEPATKAGVAVPEPPLAIGRSPVTPVDKGRPVAFVRVADAGVPSAGVTSVGLFDNTTAPVPVEVVTPVPPFATGSVPVTLVVRLVNVVELVPVPPLAIGRMPDTSVVNTAGLLAIFTKSEPFHATNDLVPEGTVTPVVGPEPRMTMEPVPALMTKYALLCAGAVMFRVVAPLLAVHRMTAFRAWLAAPLVVLRVTSVSADSVVVPATAESSNCVI